MKLRLREEYWWFGEEIVAQHSNNFSKSHGKTDSHQHTCTMALDSRVCDYTFWRKKIMREFYRSSGKHLLLIVVKTRLNQYWSAPCSSFTAFQQLPHCIKPDRYWVLNSILKPGEHNLVVRFRQVNTVS